VQRRGYWYLDLFQSHWAQPSLSLSSMSLLSEPSVRTALSLKELDFERHVVCHKRPLQPTSSQLRTLDPSSLLNSALELSQLLRTIWPSLLSLWVAEGAPFGMESPPCCPSIFHVLVKVVILTMGFHDRVSMLTLTAEGEIKVYRTVFFIALPTQHSRKWERRFGTLLESF
jgi:hypothetical protein